MKRLIDVVATASHQIAAELSLRDLSAKAAMYWNCLDDRAYEVIRSGRRLFYLESELKEGKDISYTFKELEKAFEENQDLIDEMNDEE